MGGVVGVVERLALSSGAFLPPKVLSSYIATYTESISLVHRFEYVVFSLTVDFFRIQ